MCQKDILLGTLFLEDSSTELDRLRYRFEVDRQNQGLPALVGNILQQNKGYSCQRLLSSGKIQEDME